MLVSTFCHLPGIGPRTEEGLWSAGIHTWDDLDGACPVRMTPKRHREIREHLQLSRLHFGHRPGYFADLLPSREHWRLFPDFRDRTAFLDIETTGLDAWSCAITTIALYDGGAVRTYVQGENLEAFCDDIRQYRVVVTYNGKCFDVPFIEQYLGIRMDQAHIDLRYVLRALGYSGGLKGCERQLGISRGELDGVDGFFAVLLWEHYERTGAREALDTLLAYNVQDTVNLELLMVLAYNMYLRRTPFATRYELPPPIPPVLPFRPHPRVVEEVRRSCFF